MNNAALRQTDRQTNKASQLIPHSALLRHLMVSELCVCVYWMQAHNLVYLHVNYNTFRLAFWALAHLMNNDEALAAVTSEIDDVIGTCDDVTTLSVDDVESLQVLGNYCCLSVCLVYSYVYLVH